MMFSALYFLMIGSMKLQKTDYRDGKYAAKMPSVKSVFSITNSITLKDRRSRL